MTNSEFSLTVDSKIKKIVPAEHKNYVSHYVN